MSSSREYNRAELDVLLSGLRRDIAAAQLRVVIDRKLNRVTPGAVRKFATMPLPPDLPRESSSEGNDPGAAGTGIYETTGGVSRA